MTLGENIKKYRKEKGLTQKQLSELSGVHEVQLARYENNKSKPTLETLKKIAKALDEPAYFFIDMSIEKDSLLLEYAHKEIDDLVELNRQHVKKLMKDRKIDDIAQRIKKIGYWLDVSSTFNNNHLCNLFLGKNNKYEGYVVVNDEELLQLEKECNDFLKFKLQELINSKEVNKD